MSATAWLVISIIAFSVAGISFVAAIVMFIFMKIPSVIGDLTGKTVAREVKAIRAENREKDIRHQSLSTTPRSPAPSNPFDKKAVPDSGKSKRQLERAAAQQKPGTDMLNIATDKLSEAEKQTVTASLSSETLVLTEELTDVLGQNAMTVFDAEGTTVLSDTEGTTVLEAVGTTVLGAEGTTVLNVACNERCSCGSFVIVEEKIIIHTKEVIT